LGQDWGRGVNTGQSNKLHVLVKLEERIACDSINNTSSRNSFHIHEEPRLPIEHPMDQDLGDPANLIAMVSDVLAAAKGTPVV